MTHRETLKKTELYDSYPKELIGRLPLLRFEGEIVIVDTHDKMLEALEVIRQEPLVGIDTETRPSFMKGVTWRVGLLQVATKERAWLFRLNKLGMPKAIVAFLEDASKTKVGLSLDDDTRSLQRRRESLKPQGLIDLQHLAAEFGIKDKSLRKLTANFLHHNLSKRQQLSNWNAFRLNPAQQVYAATDAWACVLIYEEMMRLKTTNAYTLIVTEVPEENNEEIEKS